MSILYSIDVDFNITIPDFAGIVNINSTSNYTKLWNEADRKGVNNNSQGSTDNNNKDNNNKKDISSIKI